MRLVTFRDEGAARIGVMDAAGAEVVDLRRAEPDLAADMIGIIRLGARGLEAAGAALATGRHRIPIDQLEILAPLPRPVRNIICIGKNYHAHAAEFHASGFDATAQDALPEAPVVFTKAPSSVIGPGAPIPAHLDPSGAVDYEGELAVVIGAPGRGIRAADAFAHVYGYTIVNDVTARGVQRRHKQWFLGKSLDGFCPMGPALLTADEVPDVTRLRLETRIGDELRQSASVADLIFDIPTLIEVISAGITLEPGDVIATGTPEGVGIGFDPPRFLKRGDQVAITIQPIGTLANPVG